MPESWNGILSTSRSEPPKLGGLPWPVELRQHHRARSLRLRLDEARELLVLTVPPRMDRQSALRWLGGQTDWIERQLHRLEPAEPFHPGGTIPFEGRDIRLVWEEGLPRKPIVQDDFIQCGGPSASFAARIERFLRDEACRHLQQLTLELAAIAGVTVTRVTVGDAQSRWGSCSSDGTIRYNWRILLAPPHLLRWLVAHEVAHRRHMNHGPEFRALESKLYGGDISKARAELRALGPRLKRVGRRSL